MARVPAEGVSPVAPIDLVPNRVGVNDDADTASTIRARQHGVADHRGTRIASDNHGRGPPLRCRISVTKRRPSWSTTSQEKGPRHCVVPSAWTVRRASSSERMFVSRRPSLVIRVHIATAPDRHCRRVHLVEPDMGFVRTGFASARARQSQPSRSEGRPPSKTLAND